MKDNIKSKNFIDKRELIEEILTDYSNWLHKEGYIDADYYAEEPKAVDAYLDQVQNLKSKFNL